MSDLKFNPLIPELSVKDLAKSLQFYVDTVGFKVEYDRKESKFVFLSFQGSQIMLEECNGNWETGPLEYPFGRGINFELFVESIEPIHQAFIAKNYPVKRKPSESWYRRGNEEVGQREFLIQDPDGYLLRFAESLGTRPLTQV